MKLGIKCFILLLFIFLTTNFSFAQEAGLPSNETMQELEQMYAMDAPDNSPALRAGPPVGPPIGGTPIGEAPIAAIAIASFVYILIKRKNRISKEII